MLAVPEVGACSPSFCPAPSLTSPHRAPCPPDDFNLTHRTHSRLPDACPACGYGHTRPRPPAGDTSGWHVPPLGLQFLTSKVDTSRWCPQTLSPACAHPSATGPGEACPLSLGSFALDSSNRHMTHFCSHQDDTAGPAFSRMRHNGTEPAVSPGNPSPTSGAAEHAAQHPGDPLDVRSFRCSAVTTFKDLLLY